MQHLDREGISFCCRTTYDDNAITNAVEIFNTSSFAFTLSGAVHFIASNNDSGVRDYDMERFQLCKHFQFEWPVNQLRSGSKQHLMMASKILVEEKMEEIARGPQ
ncbi:hypothetical protein PR202_ga02559 [Eleusine coracana subsp. coracana]|uniref:Uncharacterized protein n=1 Tax=Eleusine coracana subsp. coracana TaxID=191504 RepID=A0AAV5BLX9_ELECO|nr:hypothetical protein PR202_ga02559 [Eleusine coracana subsp. coracana]